MFVAQVSRQLERRLELLRRHLPELERKMASAIIELTHARSRWKEQLAHIQHTKVTCEQMESENEQHARRIQVLDTTTIDTTTVRQH